MPRCALCLLVLVSLALPCFADDNPLVRHPRVYVSDRDSWETAGGFTAAQGFASGTVREGIRRVNTEQIKNLNQKCPDARITGSPRKANYIVVWDTKTWQQTSWTGNQNEFVIYDRRGDVVGSGDAHRMTSAAKEICQTVMQTWQSAPEAEKLDYERIAEVFMAKMDQLRVSHNLSAEKAMQIAEKIAISLRDLPSLRRLESGDASDVERLFLEVMKQEKPELQGHAKPD